MLEEERFFVFCGFFWLMLPEVMVCGQIALLSVGHGEETRNVWQCKDGQEVVEERGRERR